MTLATTTNKASYNGTGTTGPFSFTFPFDSDSEIQVFTILGNVVTDLIDTQYTVAGAGSGAGGSVTTGAVIPVGTVLVVMRVLPLTQTTDLANQGAFFAETHEETFDRLTKQIQQLQEQINRCLRLPKSTLTDQELGAGRNGCYLLFDTDGVPTFIPAVSFSATALVTALVNAPSYELPASGEVLLINADAADVIVTPAAGDTVEMQASITLSVQYESVHLVRIGTNWYRA